ncbi:MAG: T9SS type A sorting domain-containing protein [Bacteroidota bacterium]
MKNCLIKGKIIISIFFFTLLALNLFSQGSTTLKAVSDTIDLCPGISRVYDILANDSIPANDTIRIIAIGTTGGHIQVQRVHDIPWKWTFTFLVPHWGCPQEIHGSYKLYTMSMDTSSAAILFRIHDKSYAYLNINNVSARFNAASPHFFWENPEYEVPKGSGKTSIFSNSIWVGGKDGQHLLHLAGARYLQGPGPGSAGDFPDFYAGPVMDSVNYSVSTDTMWHYVWNLKKSEIDYHRTHYWVPGYQPIHDILTWPGNGNTALGQAPKLAPFSDRNGDGIYDPYDGDYPEIRGDQALFFIFNDDRGFHYETTGRKLRVEIHGMAYAFDLPGDSALKNTTFLNYKLYNRSQNTYDSTMLGIFTDIDLGYANDDYVSCDVERNMYFGYNGTPVDGTGQPYAYGANPPTQSVTLLAGPYMDPDGIDNPRYSQTGEQLCDFSVNGINFGDSIVDNERYGLQRFIYTNNSTSGVPQYMTDPIYAPEYYNLMCGIWKDGTPIIYGGNGHAGAGGYGPACRFMFPGESDTLNWGVGCVSPNGPKNWTEETAGNAPGDRRGLGVTGPVTFKPGDVMDMDLAFTWARDYTGKSAQGSVAKLRQMADIVSKAFTSNHLPGGGTVYGINNPVSTELRVKIFPNPSSAILNVEVVTGNSMAPATLELMTAEGNCVKSLVVADRGKPAQLDVSGLPGGFYLLRVKTSESMVVKKVMIMH